MSRGLWLRGLWGWVEAKLKRLLQFWDGGVRRKPLEQAQKVSPQAKKVSLMVALTSELAHDSSDTLGASFSPALAVMLGSNVRSRLAG